MINRRSYIFRYIKTEIKYSENPKEYIRLYMKLYRLIIKKEKNKNDQNITY